VLTEMLTVIQPTKDVCYSINNEVKQKEFVRICLGKGVIW
jgi:hypothetical protein